MKNIRTITSIIALLLIITVMGCDGGASGRTNADLSGGVGDISDEPTGALFGDGEPGNGEIDGCVDLPGELELITQDNADLKAKLGEMQAEAAIICGAQQCDITNSKMVEDYESDKAKYESCFNGVEGEQSIAEVKGEVDEKIEKIGKGIVGAKAKQGKAEELLGASFENIGSEDGIFIPRYVVEANVHDSGYPNLPTCANPTKAGDLVTEANDESNILKAEINRAMDGLTLPSKIEGPNAEQMRWTGETVEAISIDVKSNAYPEIVACGGVGTEVAAMRAENDALVAAIGALEDQVETCGTKQGFWCKALIRKEYNNEYDTLLRSCQEAKIAFGRVDGELKDILAQFFEDGDIHDAYEAQLAACGEVEEEFERWKSETIVSQEDVFKSAEVLGSSRTKAEFNKKCHGDQLLTGIKVGHRDNIRGIYEIRCREWKRGTGLVGNHKWLSTNKVGSDTTTTKLECAKDFAIRNIYGSRGWDRNEDQVVGSLALECAQVGPKGLVLVGSPNRKTEKKLHPITHYTNKVGRIRNQKRELNWVYKKMPGYLHLLDDSCIDSFCSDWRTTFYKASCDDRRGEDKAVVVRGIAVGIYGSAQKRIGQLGLQCTHFRNQGRHAKLMPNLQVAEDTNYWDDNDERQVASADQIEIPDDERNELVMVGMDVEKTVYARLPLHPSYRYQPTFKPISKLHVPDETHRPFDIEDIFITENDRTIPNKCGKEWHSMCRTWTDTFSCPPGHAVTGIHHHHMGGVKIYRQDAVLLRCSPVLLDGTTLTDQSTWTGMAKTPGANHRGVSSSDKNMQRCDDKDRYVVVGLRKGPAGGGCDIRSMCTSIAKSE